MATIVSAGKSFPLIEIQSAKEQMAKFDAKMDARIREIKAKIRKMKEGK